MKKNTVLIVKESRAGEQRVALVPDDVLELVAAGHTIIIESGAGEKSGFSDDDYQQQGALIRTLSTNNQAGYQNLFDSVNLVVRAKRPDRSREQLENISITPGTAMVGALDPLENNTDHLLEYAHQQIEAYSLDLPSLTASHPMNILASMSNIAGRLALQDAIAKSPLDLIENVLLIGFGVAGQSAFKVAIEQGYATTVAATRETHRRQVEDAAARYLLLDQKEPLEHHIAQLQPAVITADIIITSARRANTVAPILIDASLLAKMKPGAVIADLSLTEGGNVAGSEHDQTITTPNGVIITNVSGYPKAEPGSASILWSHASKYFIQQFSQKDPSNDIADAKITLRKH